MPAPIFAKDPNQVRGYIDSVSGRVPGRDPAAALDQYHDMYGNIIWAGSNTAPMNAAAGSAIPATGYSNTPGPQSGTGAFGLVPGSLGTPDPAGNLSAVLPGLGAGNQAAMGSILPMLRGELAPDVKQQIENEGAGFGITSGMPGSGLATNKTLRDLGLTSLQVQQQGLGDLNNLIANTSQTQTVSPALQTQIAASNAQGAAAPNPEAAASYALRLYNKYLQSMKPSQGSQIGQQAGSIIGAAAGAYFGGPAGAGVGYTAGGSLGSSIGGSFH